MGRGWPVAAPGRVTPERRTRRDGAVADAAATRFVLIEPSHAGNVGAVARAMHVMGFDDLVVVRPRWADVLIRPETLQRASGADHILQCARAVATLDEALEGMSHVCATVMTARDFGPPTRTPRAHFAALLDGMEAAQHPELPARPPQGVALLFGCERYGMANEDVYRCHVALSIPTNPAFGSLNLAAAVQLIAYDWRLALVAHAGGRPPSVPPGVPEHVPADAAALAGMLAHWRAALLAIGFLDPAVPKRLMPRLQQLFGRARPSADEINLLRGIAKSMQRAAARARNDDAPDGRA